MPKVSVVVPVCNVEKYLEQCLDSIINQTLKDIEIICVNDGSTDNSSDILDRYARMDSRIKAVHKENRGYGHTMNVGMDLATGDYIGIVESDDWIENDMYEKLYEAAIRYELDFVKADYNEFFVNQDKSIDKVYRSLSWNKADYHRVINPQEELKSFYFRKYTWSGIYKNEFLKKNQIKHNETPGASYQDNGFWFQTFVCAKRSMLIDQAYYMYKQDNPNSSINSKGKIYAVPNEFDFIKVFLNRIDIGYRYLYLCSYFRLTNCLGNIARVDDTLKLEFIEKIRQDYIETIKNKEIDESLFDVEALIKLHKIMNNSKSYYNEIMGQKKKYLDLFNEYSSIVIYGAGKIGKNVFRRLKINGLVSSKFLFATTNSCDISDEVMNVPVKGIYDLEREAIKSLIILAVSKKGNSYNEMNETLFQLGFHNCIDYEEFLKI